MQLSTVSCGEQEVTLRSQIYSASVTGMRKELLLYVFVVAIQTFKQHYFTLCLSTLYTECILSVSQSFTKLWIMQICAIHMHE